MDRDIAYRSNSMTCAAEGRKKLQQIFIFSKSTITYAGVASFMASGAGCVLAIADRTSAVFTCTSEDFCEDVSSREWGNGKATRIGWSNMLFNIHKNV